MNGIYIEKNEIEANKIYQDIINNSNDKNSTEYVYSNYALAIFHEKNKNYENSINYYMEANKKLNYNFDNKINELNNLIFNNTTNNCSNNIDDID